MEEVVWAGAYLGSWKLNRCALPRALQISKTLTQPDYVVETKYDGDRMLLHYEQGKPMKVYARLG